MGGATAVLVGWRETTLDVDLKLDPEPPGAFEAIAALKDDLGVNIELAAPDDFIPALPGWRDRSPYVAACGAVEFFHYDLYSQALAKVERGHETDRRDVREMLGRGLVDRDELRKLFDAIEPHLVRYPAVDPAGFRKRLLDAIRPEEEEGRRRG